MKKVALVLLVLAICFGVCACTNYDSAENPFKKYEKYDELYKHLENNDYESAIAYVQGFFGKTDVEGSDDNPNEDDSTVPIGDGSGTTEATSTIVEITLDNWQDYFELCEYTEFVENGFGEIDDATTYWTLASKDEYAVDINNCDVTFEYSCDVDVVAATIDTAAKKVIYGEVTDNYTTDQFVETMNGVSQYIGSATERYGEYVNCSFFDMEDGQLVSVFDVRTVKITVIRISGTFSYFE